MDINRKEDEGDRAGTFYERSHPSGEEGGGSGGGADRPRDCA